MLTRSLSRKRPLLVSTVGAAAVVALCFTSLGTTQAASKGTRTSSSGVLTVSATASSVGVSRDFNPFSPTSRLTTAGGMGVDAFIYEPLLQFNTVRSQVIPWLATKYSWSDGGRALTFTIRQGVKWSDGTPFTTADVAFTYGMLKKYPAMNATGVRPVSVLQSGDTVTLRFATPQYQRLQAIASVLIVQRATWSKVSNPSTYTAPNPVGTGMFILASFTPQEIILNKNQNYWQPGVPKVSKIDYPIYTSNTTLQEALAADQVEWSCMTYVGIKKSYLDTSPSHHYWGVPLYAITLYPNLKVFPTNLLPVRQAISLAIDRSALARVAESGLATPMTNAAGLPEPLSGYLVPSVAKMTLRQDISAARRLLTKAGFVMGKHGFFETKSGKELKVTITTASAWSDFVQGGSMMVQNLRAAGIDASFFGQSTGGFMSSLAQGNFQLAQFFGTLIPGITPYTLYNSWLSSSLTAPIGKTAAGDYERLNNPAIDKALNKFAAARTHTEVMRALAPIERYMATQVPVIPLFGMDAFDEYNDQNWIGWPSASNPYAEGDPGNVATELVLLHLRPR